MKFENKEKKLETDRLYLKKYSKDNIDDYYKLKSCDEIWKYSTFIPIKEKEQVIPLLNEAIVNFEKNQYGFQALYRKENDTYIGEAGILSYSKNSDRCVIGYNLLPEYWQNDYATEISRALVKCAFEILKVERVEALAMEENIASCKVLENAGLLKEGTLKHFAKCNDTYKNVVNYGVVREDYFQ